MNGSGLSSVAQSALGSKASPMANGHGQHIGKERQSCCFQMPLHYPRYSKSDYEKMPEWKLNCLFTEYGLPVSGDLNYKRNYAMDAFLWP